MGRAEQHATKKDIAELKSGLESKLGSAETRLDAKIHALDAKIDDRFDTLTATTKTLALEIVRNQAEIREVKSEMATKTDVERIMRSLDAVTAQAIHYQRADMTRGQSLIDVELKLGEHERRISALESAPRPPAT